MPTAISTKSKLKRALEAIDAARRALLRAKDSLDDPPGIDLALSDMDEAESEIRRAMRDLPDD